MTVDYNGHDVEELHPSLQALLRWCEEQPWNIRITSTGRDVAEQTRLFNIGRSTENPWNPTRTAAQPFGPTVAPSIDPAQHSKRSDGYVHAFDCYPTNVANTAERHDVFQAMAFAAGPLGVTWGGVWNYPDDVHFENSSWKQVPPSTETISALAKARGQPVVASTDGSGGTVSEDTSTSATGGGIGVALILFGVIGASFFLFR